MKIGWRWLRAARAWAESEREKGRGNEKFDVDHVARRMKQLSMKETRKGEVNVASRDWTPVPGSKCPIKPMRKLPRYINLGINNPNA